MGQQAAVISCCLLLPPVGTLPYCSSPDYTYYYSDDYIYEAPECRAMALEQIVKKLDGVVYIITQFQERFEVGWPCSQYKDDDCNSSLFDAAHTGQPTLIKRAGGQCVCLSGCVHSPSLTAPSVLLSARSSPPTSLCLLLTASPPLGLLASGRRPSSRWAWRTSQSSSSTRSRQSRPSRTCGRATPASASGRRCEAQAAPSRAHS